MTNVLRLVDELEQLVEKGSGLMGKKLVNEKEFFTQIQRLRMALPQSLKDAEDAARTAPREIGQSETVPRESSKSVRDFIEDSRFLSNKEQLQILAALSARLLEKQL